MSVQYFGSTTKAMYIEQTYVNQTFDTSERLILDHIIENASSTTRSIGINKFCAMCTKNVGYHTVFRLLNILMMIFSTIDIANQL